MPPKKRKTGTLKQNKQPVSSQKKAKKVEVVEEAIVEKTVVEKVAEETTFTTPKIWAVRFYDKVNPEHRIGNLIFNEKTGEFDARFDGTPFAGELKTFMSIRDENNTLKWMQTLGKTAKDALRPATYENIIIGEVVLVDEAE